MTKEEILAELKSLIQSLIDDVEKFKEDENFAKGWMLRQKRIGVEINKLNSCDSVWLTDEYGAWLKKTVQSQMDKLPDMVKNSIDWK